MALSSLFPKGFFDWPASSPSPASSSSTASPELDPMDRLPGRDKDGKLKLPPVAIYVSGAAVSYRYDPVATPHSHYYESSLTAVRAYRRTHRDDCAVCQGCWTQNRHSA